MTCHARLSLQIPDAATLLSAYMPFLEHGGIFVPTRQVYRLGQPLVLLLTLPGDEEPLEINGAVAWISPEDVGGHRIPGIGVHFDHQAHPVRDRIETLLAGKLDKPVSSYTL